MTKMFVSPNERVVYTKEGGDVKKIRVVFPVTGKDEKGVLTTKQATNDGQAAEEATTFAFAFAWINCQKL